MSKFFNPLFYFDTNIDNIHLPTMYAIIGIFTLFLIIGFFGLFLAAKKESTDKIIAVFLNKLANWGLWTGVIGLLLSFFRYQRAIYLGMRIWLILWLLISLVWLAFILKFLLKDIPKLRQEKIKKQEFNKYLPK